MPHPFTKIEKLLQNIWNKIFAYSDRSLISGVELLTAAKIAKCAEEGVS